MKALKEMTNVEKGYLLVRLFPESLKDLFDFIKLETEYFRANEETIRTYWRDNSFVTVNFWFNLVRDIEQILRRFNVTLYRNPRVFSDQLFYGFFAVFTVNSLIEYAERDHCSVELKAAIHLFFGKDKMYVAIR